MLSAVDIDHFHEQGFVVLRGLLDPTTVGRLQAEIDDLHEAMAREPVPGVALAWEAGVEPPRIRQLMHSERVNTRLDDLSRAPRLLDVLEQLVGPDLVLFHSKLLMKAARDGSFTPWHQDWGYWCRESREPRQVNCMLAIDAADEANGCIRFVPGSHRRGPIAHRDLQSDSFALGLPGDLDAFDSVAVPLDAGDAVLFGALVVHGSGPNASDRDRRANTFAFDVPGNSLRPVRAERLRRGRLSAKAISGNANPA